MIVLVPHRDHPGRLAETLASLGVHPVLVIDDSDEGCGVSDAEVLRTRGGEGFARSVNRGLEAAASQGHELALLLNDDARPRPGCLEGLLAAWTEDDGALAPVLHEDVPLFGMDIGPFGRLRPRTRPGESTVDAVSGACVLVRTSERLDESYAHGFEDVELCRRLRQRGLRVRVVDSAHCDHEGGGTVSRESRAAQRHAVSGHLRYLNGGWRAPMAVVLSVAQVVREGGPWNRLLGVAEGCRDHYWGG